MLSNYSSGNIADVVSNFYSCTGNSRVTGFLGEKIDNLTFDSNGNVEFTTLVNDGESEIMSWCTLFEDSILVKQVEKCPDVVDTRLYSYDVLRNKYTYLSLATKDSLNNFYDTMKRFEMNLCDGDITEKFKKMGLRFDDVIQILLNQSFITTNIEKTNYVK